MIDHIKDGNMSQPMATSTQHSTLFGVEPFAPWPAFAPEDIEAACRVLQSGKVNYWTGVEGRLFEEEYACYTGSKYAIALANGTVALELALLVLGVGPGDDVIVPSRTFIASASCAVARGARPVIADVDRNSQVVTSETIEAVLTPKTKAIIAVHLAGWPCDMDPILQLAHRHGIAVIEDCAQAHGAQYKGRHIGTLGDIGAFSFCQDKIITTAGEGGMLVTDRHDLWENAWRYKDHGKMPDSFYKPLPPSTQYRWLHESFGSNFRLSEVQSAIGRLALRRLPDWIQARRRNATTLQQTCNEFAALRTPVPPDNILHAYYKFYTFVDQSRLKPEWSRDRIISEIREKGVPCFSGSCSEIYLENAFQNKWKPPFRLEVAKELGESSLMFLVHPTLTERNISDTCRVIREIMTAASLSDLRSNPLRAYNAA